MTSYWKRLRKRRALVASALIVVLVAIIVGLVVRRHQTRCVTQYFTYDVISKWLDGAYRRLLVADTPDKQQYGLMFVTGKDKICGADGMVFPFGTDAQRAFWNLNTLRDLDVYWMNDGQVLSKIIMRSINATGTVQTYYSPVKVDTVVELLREE